MIAEPAESSHQRAVIPESPILLPFETIEHFRSLLAQVGQDRTRVMQLVRGGNEPGAGVSLRQMRDVSFFALQPWRRPGDFGPGRYFAEASHAAWRDFGRWGSWRDRSR